MSTVFPPFEPNGQDDGGRGPKLRQIPVRLLVPNFITVLAICAGMTGIRLAIENKFLTNGSKKHFRAPQGLWSSSGSVFERHSDSGAARSSV